MGCLNAKTQHSQQNGSRTQKKKIVASAQKTGVISQLPHQVGTDQGHGEDFSLMEKICNTTDCDKKINKADLKDGMNLICVCFSCGTKDNSKQFVVSLYIESSWSIPRILMQVKCPDCGGTPSDNQVVVGTMAFYNCSWNITGSLKTGSELSISQKTPKNQLTYLLSDANSQKVEYNYLRVCCGQLE